MIDKHTRSNIIQLKNISRIKTKYRSEKQRKLARESNLSLFILQKNRATETSVKIIALMAVRLEEREIFETMEKEPSIPEVPYSEVSKVKSLKFSLHILHSQLKTPFKRNPSYESHPISFQRYCFLHRR